jgi:hypothetical protein
MAETQQSSVLASDGRRWHPAKDHKKTEKSKDGEEHDPYV